MAAGAEQTGWCARGRDALERWLEAERDQLANWLVVGLGAGIVAWFALALRSAWIAFGLTMLAAAIVARIVSRDRVGKAVALFALAAVIGLGAIWWRAERVAEPVLARGAVAAFESRIVRIEPQPAQDRTRLTLTPIARPDLPPQVRVNVDADKMVAGLTPGAQITIRARLVPPSAAAVPGGYDFARTAWFQGLGATGKALDPVRLNASPGTTSADDWLARRRSTLTAHIQAQVPGSAGGIATAFVTGDRGAIDASDTLAMQRAGLTHLLSISGLHVTAVIAATMLLTVRLLALSPWLALRAPLPLIGAATGALAGVAYTLLSGSEVPTIRSCVAALLVLAGLALGREAITMRLVASGALVILLIWPEALAGPSFELSFAAVTAIVGLHEQPRLRAFFLKRDEAMIWRLARALLSLLLTGLVVEAALAPIALFHFHKAGLYGSIANIVAIPLTTFVIMPLEAGALLLDIGGLGAPLWWMTARAMGVLLWVAHHVADMPGAVAALPTMPDGAFALMAAGGLWIALWRTRWRRLGWVPIVIGAAWMLETPAPDLLVTGDGRHMAIRRDDGSLALLRPRAGDYVREVLGETAGTLDAAAALDWLPEANCTADFCSVTLERGKRRWHILATRSPYLIPVPELAQACATADIVVSERRLPRACRPAWLRIDRALLARTGGLAIGLASGRIRTVFHAPDDHPWRTPPTVQPADADQRRRDRRRRDQ